MNHRPFIPIWLDFWYQNYSKPTLRPKTQLDYESCIYQHIISKLGSIPLNQPTQNDLQQFYAYLRKSGRLIRADVYGSGLSDRMVRACHTRCRTALGKAAEEGYYELFLLELATELRRGEVLALQWDDLNLDTGELRIERQVYRTNGELAVSAPKTKASLRTVVLPPSLVEVPREYRLQVDSRWMFPSPVKEESPLDPAACRKRLQTILKHAGCKRVRFHDLRHLFVTTALESGVDAKTLSTIIGHVSAKTTLNIYTHVTDAMQETAAAKIDRGIGKYALNKAAPSQDEGLPARAADTRRRPVFEPYKCKYRKPGTGCVTQIGDHLWEGKYSPKWPDGKRHSRSIYAGTEHECEAAGRTDPADESGDRGGQRTDRTGQNR